MSDITLSAKLSIRALKYNSYPATFNDNLEGDAKGPSPGEILVPVGGREVLFTEVLPVGWCFIKNNDPTNFVTVGVYDGTSFFPVLEFPPGVGYPVFLSRFLNQEFTGTGSGTNADINKLYVEAHTAPCRVLFDGFGR